MMPRHPSTHNLPADPVIFREAAFPSGGEERATPSLPIIHTQFSQIILSTAIAIVPQLVVWIAKPDYGANWWLIFSAFFFGIVNLLVMIVAFWRDFKNEMLRKFSI